MKPEKVEPIRKKKDDTFEQMARDLIEEIRAGKVEAIAIVTVRPGAEGGGCRLAYRHGAGGSYYALLGAICDLKQDILLAGRKFTQVE